MEEVDEAEADEVEESASKDDLEADDVEEPQPSEDARSKRLREEVEPSTEPFPAPEAPLQPPAEAKRRRRGGECGVHLVIRRSL